MDMFCCIPRPLQIALEKWEVKRGSLSNMMHLGSPNQGTRCRRYSRATPVLSMSFLHGINFAALEHPWSMMVRILSNPCDGGRSVMRSIETYWNGPWSTAVSNRWRGAFRRGRLVFDSWHLLHPLTYSLTNSLSLGPS